MHILNSSAVSIALVAASFSIRIDAAQVNPSGTPSGNPSGPPKFSLRSNDLFPDKVLARGRGVEVKQSQLDEMYLSFKAHRAAMGIRVPESARPKIESEILDKLISTQLVLNLATDADRAKARQLAAEFITEQKKQLPTEESFKRQLTAVGMTSEQFEAQVLEQAIVKCVMDRELKSKKSVSEQQMRLFYDKNPGLFAEPELVRVSHILFATHNLTTGKPLSEEQKAAKKALAKAVLDRARSGEDFAKLVAAFSEDAASKANGGEYRIAKTNADRPAPEFDAAAFSLALNQISDIVTTRYGYHIIKLLEKTPSRMIEFEKVKERIRETLLQEEVQKDLPSFVAELKKKAGVEMLTSPLGSP